MNHVFTVFQKVLKALKNTQASLRTGMWIHEKDGKGSLNLHYSSLYKCEIQ